MLSDVLALGNLNQQQMELDAFKFAGVVQGGDYLGILRQGVGKPNSFINQRLVALEDGTGRSGNMRAATGSAFSLSSRQGKNHKQQ